MRSCVADEKVSPLLTQRAYKGGSEMLVVRGPPTAKVFFRGNGNSVLCVKFCLGNKELLKSLQAVQV